MSRTDEKNFRSHYYERVGFRGVDEKKTLEMLLSEDPRSIEKLQQFCLRFSVPAIMRLEAWKVIYEVSALYAKNTEEKWWWKEKPYYHIKRVQRVLGKVHEGMSLAEELTVQFLLRERWIKFDVKSQMKEFNGSNFHAIVKTMLYITENDEVVSYYLAQELTRFLKSFTQKQMLDLKQSYHRILSNDPNTSKLYSHCEKIGFNELLSEKVLSEWFHRAFAGVIHDDALVKVWDKVIGGSMKILVYVALALVEAFQIPILQCQTGHEALDVVETISEETSGIVTQKAIDVWFQAGCQILASDPVAKWSGTKIEPPSLTSSSPLVTEDEISNTRRLVSEIKVDDDREPPEK